MSSKAFEILDNLGCPRIVCGHPTQQVIATESGCSLLFCDLANDKKIKMHRHENNISDILISEKYLFSVDQGPKVSVLISDINTLKRIYQFYLPPHKLRGDKPAHSVLLAYSDKFQRIVLLENEYSGGYRLTGWEFKQEKLVKLFFVADIETTHRCLSLQILENASDLIVITAEQNMIKYWKIESKQAILTNRIHIKEEIGQVLSDNNYRIILALTKTGKIILLNSQGDYLDTIKGEKPFSCMAAYSTYCFFGTIYGSIQIYDLQKNQKINEIPYLQEIKDSFCLEKELDEIIEKEDGSEANYNSFSGKSSSFNQSQISNGNMISIVYADGLQLAYDISSNKVISQQIGHYQKINQIEWDLERQSRFFSVGSDGYFAAWNLYHDRWVGKIFDIHKTFDKEQQTSFSLSKKNHFIQLTGSQASILSSHPNQGTTVFNKEPQQRIKLTSMAINYSYKEIYIGDSKGYITTLDLETLQLTKKYKVCNFKIKKMKLCPQSSYLAVVLSTGMSILLDILNQFQLVLKIEDHIHTNSPSTQKGFRDIYCILDSSVASNEEKIRQATRLSNQVQISQNISQTLQQQQAQKMRQSNMNNSMIQDSLKKIKLQSSQTKFNAGSYFNQLNEVGGLKTNTWYPQGKSSYKKEDPNQFLVIATNTYNQMRLHSVQINVLDDSVTGMALMIYQTEGRITGCDIHPSREYILILDDIGLAYLYKIRSGELRGRIEVPQFSSNVSIDPSGLYFAINSYQQYPEYYISDTEEENDDNFENGQVDQEEDNNLLEENVSRNQNDQQTLKKIKDENNQLKKGSKNGSQAFEKIQKSYLLREFGKIRDPHAIQQEIQRDINLYEKNAQSSSQITNGNHQSQEIKPVKYFEMIESFLHPSKFVIKPKMVLLYELGTGKQAGFIQNLFNASAIKFSHNSEYLAIASAYGDLSLWGLNDDINQNIQGVFQQMESSPMFWSNFPIYIQKNLKLIDKKIKRSTFILIEHKDVEKLLKQLSFNKWIIEFQIRKQSQKSSFLIGLKIDDINSYQPQQLKENSIDNLSPIHKTIKESSEQNQYIRSQNFERAYQKLTPKSNQLQQHSNKNELQKNSKNNFFQFNNLIQPTKVDQNFIKRQINEQPMKILPGIKLNPNISLSNLGIQSPNQKRQIFQRQVLDNPPDIDDDVIPIQNPLIYSKNYTSSKNLIQGVSPKVLQQQMKTAYEQSSKSSSRPLTPLLENPMDDIAQFEFKLAKTKTHY
ncbi:hypothetical protein ABPG74_002064 [Tetrahymena malaccensis]